ncbi:12154_t:CDS:2, partial [Acaulospora morrowiae]
MAERLDKGIGEILKKNNELKEKIEETIENYEKLYKEKNEINEALRLELKRYQESIKEIDNKLVKVLDTDQQLRDKYLIDIQEQEEKERNYGIRANVENETLSEEFNEEIGEDTIENLQRKVDLETMELRYWQEKVLRPKYEYHYEYDEQIR